MALVTSSERSSASRWRTESGSPASTERIDRRARPAARVPPGTQNETVFVSIVLTGRRYLGGQGHRHPPTGRSYLIRSHPIVHLRQQDRIPKPVQNLTRAATARTATL